MQISPTTSISPVTPPDRTDLGAQVQTRTFDAATKLKGTDAALAEPKVFTPAPPLRPNVQDFVDIDRTLIMLRQAQG